MKDKDFCNKLFELRKKAGLTQVELEAKADMPASLISHYEVGERQPGLQSIKSLCKGLGCTATDLLGV